MGWTNVNPLSWPDFIDFYSLLQNNALRHKNQDGHRHGYEQFLPRDYKELSPTCRLFLILLLDYRDNPINHFVYSLQYIHILKLPETAKFEYFQVLNTVSFVSCTIVNSIEIV